MDDFSHPGILDIDPDDVIASEVIAHADPANDRSIARRVALQALYEIDSADHEVGEVLNTLQAHHHLNTKTSKYVQQLVRGVIENHRRLDTVIRHFAPEFPLSQVAIVDRNILRIAIFEFTITKRAPLKVAIDEAVELAKLFGADGASRFVNGVLGAAAANLDELDSMLGIIQDESDENKI